MILELAVGRSVLRRARKGEYFEQIDLLKERRMTLIKGIGYVALGIVIWIAIALAGGLSVAAVIVAWDSGTRFFNWRTLSKTEIVDAFSDYLNIHQIDAVYGACVYAVSCDGDRARLTMIKDWDAWVLRETKATIWHRRFNKHCEGETANLGLHIIPFDPESDEPRLRVQTPVWSFRTDGFVSRAIGQWSSPIAFSEEPWERCSASEVLLGHQQRL